jgi:glucose/mannose-6-phosphate isomerase
VKELNNLSLFEKLDPDDMLRRVAELPRQCRDAWAGIMSLELPDDDRTIRNIVVLGIGGSAIGGDLLRTLVKSECSAPIVVNRDYTLPAFVGPETLVIVSSYSGNTEETLTTFDLARQTGARMIAFSTGGQVAARAGEWGVTLFGYDYSSQPRAALGYSLVPLLGLLVRLGLIADKAVDVEEAAAVMDDWRAEIRETVPFEENVAKQLAAQLYGHLPVVYGAGYLSEVARRWKGQFNENAKNWAAFEQMPELNHNAVVGYDWPADLAKEVVVVVLRSSLDHPRDRVRFDVTGEILAQKGVAYETVNARGHSPLAQMLSTIHFGDYVSYYLAMLNRTDPTPVKTIAYLKGRLAEAKV